MHRDRVDPDVLRHARDLDGVQLVVVPAAPDLDGERDIDGGTQRDGSLRFAVQGQATAEGLRRATELGADRFITKPFDLTEFLSLLEAATGCH